MSIHYFDMNGGGRPGGSNIFGNIGCLLFGVLFIVATYYILKGLFYVLLWLSPVFLIAALLINWRVVTGSAKAFFAMFQRNPIGGLLTGALIVLAFPFVAFLLFISALGSKRLKKMQDDFEKQMGGRQEAEVEFVEFEEIESTPMKTSGPEESFELPKLPENERLENERQKKSENPYDQMF